MRTSQIKIKESELKAGLHKVIIEDIFSLKDENNNVVRLNGKLIIIVRFKNNKGFHEQGFIIDNGARQKYFNNILRCIRVNHTPLPKKEELLGKELFIAVREVHHVEDDKVVMHEGKPKIEYSLFMAFPDSLNAPKIKGDPQFNNGIPQEEFITYKNIAS